MRLNKEQILFLVVVALAAWIWRGQKAVTLPRTAQARALAHEAAPGVQIVLRAWHRAPPL